VVGVAQSVRASGCGPEGRRFDPGRSPRQFCVRDVQMRLFASRVTLRVTPRVDTRLMTRVCTQCGRELSLSEFNYRDRKHGVLHRRCRVCTRMYFREYYARHRQEYIVRIRKKNAAERRCNREQLVAYLRGHPCIDCGETDPVVLQFDHDDRTIKSCNVGDLLRSRVPWARILTEIEKCSVRCANDHQRRTAEQFGWYKLDAQSSAAQVPTLPSSGGTATREAGLHAGVVQARAIRDRES
jgi:hypothetical protein